MAQRLVAQRTLRVVQQESPGLTGWDLFVVDLQREGRPLRPYLATEAMERTGVFSPDERWVAYSSNVSGVLEVYLSTFPEHGRRWQVSRGGGMLPLWAATEASCITSIWNNASWPYGSTMTGI